MKHTPQQIDEAVARLEYQLNRSHREGYLRDTYDAKVLGVVITALREAREELVKVTEQFKTVTDGTWNDGVPNKIYAEEWFIAVLDNGDKVVLRSLPEESSYAFTTADATYYRSDKVKKWMQFPTSGFWKFKAIDTAIAGQKK